MKFANLINLVLSLGAAIGFLIVLINLFNQIKHLWV